MPRTLKAQIEDLVWSPECALPTHLRGYVMCLAYLADWRTGWCNQGAQQRIAAALGCSVRSVKRYRAELEQLPNSPVTVEWHEGQAYMRGGVKWVRPSDRYKISVREAEHSSSNGDNLSNRPPTVGQLGPIPYGDNLSNHYGDNLSPYDPGMSSNIPGLMKENPSPSGAAERPGGEGSSPGEAATHDALEGAPPGAPAALVASLRGVRLPCPIDWPQSLSAWRREAPSVVLADGKVVEL